MPYALRYQIPYLNSKGKNFRIDLLLKDYSGTSNILDGAPEPFALRTGQDTLLPPLNPQECSVNFFNDGSTPLTTFYSEDDEAWMIKHYSTDAADVLLWAGFIVQDDCSEHFIDPPYIVQLKGTDNLALLRNVSFDIAWRDSGYKTIYEQNTNEITVDVNHVTVWVTPPVIVVQDTSRMQYLSIGGVMYTIAVATPVPPLLGMRVIEPIPQTGNYVASWIIYSSDPLIDKITYFRYLQTCLSKTGLSLPLEIYSNLYENSMQDRTANPLADPFQQTRLFSGMFSHDDGTWDSCYDVLEKLMLSFNATLEQSRGRWIVIRLPELRLFSGNAIRGTAYDSSFTNPTAITFSPNLQVVRESNICFINADGERRIYRPLKYVKSTFKFQQAKSLIKGNDLKTLGAFKSTRTGTVNGITYRYDDYEIPQQWRHVDNDTSIIEVVTDTSVNPETEKDRYVLTPGSQVETRGVRFNDIEVSAGDSFNLTLQFRLPTDVSDDAWQFAVKFYLRTVSGDFYNLAPNSVNGVLDPLLWVKNWNANYTYPIAVKKDTDSSQWMTWSLEHYLYSLEGKKLPLIPEDGVLVITVTAVNYSTNSTLTGFWKDITLEFSNFINYSTKITGQSHQNSIASMRKNNLERDIAIDDSPRNPVAGTLFTSQLIDFGGDIGQKYFIKTKAWHRAALAESRRLGDITTGELEQIQSIVRTQVEGTIDNDVPAISPLNIVQIDTLPGLNFAIGISEFNFMSGNFKATLWEIYKTGEADAAITYFFDYQYEQS